MGWRHTPTSYLLLLAAVVAGALAFHAWRRRHDAPGASSLAAFLIAVCWWEAGYALELGAGDLQAKIFWAKVEYLGIVMVPLFWLVFALRYTGRERWLTHRNFALLGAPLLVTLALVFTNEAHNLIWTRTALDPSGTFPLLEVDYGAWFWVHWVYSLLLVLLGTVLLVSSLPRSLRLYQKQSWALLIAASMPWLGNVIYVLGLGPVPNLDLTSFAFLLSGVAMSLGFSRFGLLNLIPVARNKVVEGMRDGVIVLDPHHRIVDLNPAASRILGLSTAEGAGTNIAQVIPGGIPLSGADHSAGETHREIEVGEGPSRRYYDLTLSPLGNYEERRTGHLLTLRDATERKQTEERINDLNEGLERQVAQRTEQLEAAVAELRDSELELRGSEERFRSLVRHASDIITVLEADGTIRFESPAVETTLGYDSEEMVGKNIFDYIHPDDREEAFRVFSVIVDGSEKLPPLQCRFRHADGYWKYLEAVGSNQLENPSVAGIVCNCRDITERKILEEQIEHRAFHDSLTNLPNRTLFLDRLEHALARVERRPKPLAMLFLDLDNFKVVNDSLGHEAGDQLLIEFARRLQECLRPEDTAARFGGDEFAVLLEDLTYMSDVTKVVDRIVEGLETPFLLDETSREVFITASIGVAGRFGGEDPKDLLRAADLAMYEAKGSGKARYVVFDPTLERQVHERLELESDLRRALASGEIKVHYQPQASLDTEDIVGMEALARWENPERGMILPEKFIPLAEETGLIVPLGRYVLEEACRQLKVWHEQHPRNPPLTMSVNLSLKQFRNPALTGEILNTLKEINLAPETLVLEITESAAVEDAKSATFMLETIRELGVKIAIDDFGKGYSSLSYLRRLPVDSVKIDHSMIERLETDAGDWAIVSSTIMLAHTLKLEAVAEGVESAGQARRLRTLRCDTGQGYYWWKPGPAETIAALLTSQDEGSRSPGQPAGSGKI